MNKSLKSLTFLALGIFLISLIQVSATELVELTGGESGNLTLDTNEPVKLQVVEGEIQEGVNFVWNQEGNLVKYQLGLSVNDTILLKWYTETNEDETDEGDVSSGGGSSKPFIFSLNKMKEGFERTLKEGKSINFKIKDIHQLTVKDVSNDSATFIIKSNPVEITLKENETKSQCLTESEKILLTNLILNGDFVHFRLKSIDASGCQTMEQKTQGDDTEQDNDNSGYKDNPGYLLMIIILFMIFVLVVIIITKNEYNKKFSKEKDFPSESNELNKSNNGDEDE